MFQLLQELYDVENSGIATARKTMTMLGQDVSARDRKGWSELHGSQGRAENIGAMEMLE